jgi:serine/threonine protein kinase
MQLITDKNPLGKGFNGTVYRCKYNNTDAILKMEKYLPTEPQFTRQVNFDLLVAKKHPNRFLQLLHAGIINDCVYKFNPKIAKDLPKLIKKRIADLKASKQCSVLIYSPVLHYTLGAVIDRLTLDQRKATYRHLRKSLDIMHRQHITHNDIHTTNIMCDKPNDPTSYMLIDYGTVIDATDKQTAADQLMKKYACDDAALCWSFICDFTILYMIKNFEKATNIDVMYRAVNKLISGTMHNEVKCFILYCKDYREYLKILGCTTSQIAKAQQDPLAGYFLHSLLSCKN